MGFPPIPPEVKIISHFLKVAEEHDARNIVVSYWARMYATQMAMKALPGQKPPDVSRLLIAIIEWLEQTKAENQFTDGIINETCAQAMIEEYAIKLFTYAEDRDKAQKFDKNMIKAFYTSSILFDILVQFGTLPEDIEEKRKYARWRAAYIHNCLKTGQQPTPGSTVIFFSDEDEDGKLSEYEPKDITVNGPSDPVSPAPNAGSFGSLTPPDEGSPHEPVSVPPQPSPYEPVSVPLQPSPHEPISVPFQPSPSSTNDVQLTPDQVEKAQKYCKWAGSALNYDDVKTAIDNLQKALHLLQFGKEI